jgi:hypothetical protein
MMGRDGWDRRSDAERWLELGAGPQGLGVARAVWEAVCGDRTAIGWEMPAAPNWSRDELDALVEELSLTDAYRDQGPRRIEEAILGTRGLGSGSGAAGARAGQFDTHVPYLLAARDVGGVAMDARDSAVLDAFAHVCKSSGPWWAAGPVVICTERPQSISLDIEGRLHTTSGPAVSYDDGTEVWAVEGITVPPRIVQGSALIDRRAIEHELDPSLRQVYIALYGRDRFYAERRRARGGQTPRVHPVFGDEPPTPELQARLTDYAEQWRAVARSTRPADRHRAELAFQYLLGDESLFGTDSRGRPRIEWVLSPQAALSKVRQLDSQSPVPYPQWHRPRMESEWRDAARERLGPLPETLRLDDSSTPLWNAVGRPTEAETGVPVSGRGQFDADTPVLAALRDVFGEELDEPHSRRLEALLDIVRSCGPWWALGRAVVAVERPSELHWDSSGRPHSDSGPAIVYRDGFAVWAWHGVTVDEDVVLRPEEITVAAIDREDNVEVRRTLIERFGIERFIRDGGGQLVHEDETGRLWRRATPPKGERLFLRNVADGSVREVDDEFDAENYFLDEWMVANDESFDIDEWEVEREPTFDDEDIVMVEVQNATPEPDGSRKTYFLRVPPTMATARQAVAWTFGKEEREYAPDRET